MVAPQDPLLHFLPSFFHLSSCSLTVIPSYIFSQLLIPFSVDSISRRENRNLEAGPYFIQNNFSLLFFLSPSPSSSSLPLFFLPLPLSHLLLSPPFSISFFLVLLFTLIPRFISSLRQRKEGEERSFFFAPCCTQLPNSFLPHPVLDSSPLHHHCHHHLNHIFSRQFFVNQVNQVFLNLSWSVFDFFSL